MNQLPELLQLDDVGEARYRVHQPETSGEGRDVVFGGQLLAQMIMASDAAVGGAKEVKSIHAIFARPGTHTQPIELEVDTLHDGRSWGSHTITAWQGDRRLSRSMVLLNVDDPDLMRHQVAMPAGVPGPDEAVPGAGLVFPGAELRRVDAPEATVDGVPAMWFWTRMPAPVPSLAASQAIMAWATNGFFIELAMRPHADKVTISDAHRTVATGVIGHTISFHERIDASQWLLLAHEATYAGRGRIHGRGLVFTEDGQLVATFSQDSMART